MLLALLLVIATADAPLDVRAAPKVVPLVMGDGLKGLSATFLIEGSPDDVLLTLWDIHRFKSIFPDIKSVEVLVEKVDLVEARFQVHAVFDDVSYVLRRRLDRDKRRVDWVSIDGDIKRILGSWEVEATADPLVSKVAYTSFVDVSLLVPQSVVRNVAMNKVAQMVERVRGACAPRRDAGSPAPSDAAAR
jgi:ribosome-associated toxin RatA of RatAB toxin-antitoxin module